MSTCKACGARVAWKLTDGRWQCFNPDASIHWDQCSKRKWDQVKSTGTKFTGKDHLGREIAGYKNSVHGTKLERIRSKVIHGKNKSGLRASDPNKLPWD